MSWFQNELYLSTVISVVTSRDFYVESRINEKQEDIRSIVRKSACVLIIFYNLTTQSRAKDSVPS